MHRAAKQSRVSRIFVLFMYCVVLCCNVLHLYGFSLYHTIPAVRYGGMAKYCAQSDVISTQPPTRPSIASKPKKITTSRNLCLCLVTLKAIQPPEEHNRHHTQSITLHSDHVLHSTVQVHFIHLFLENPNQITAPTRRWRPHVLEP